MTTRTTTKPGAPRRSPLANEDGMLLVITMVILLVVSTLAAANLINAFLERSLAQNQNNASVALNAADGGIQDGLAWLNDETNLPTIPTAASPWSRAGDPVARVLVPDPYPDGRDGSVNYAVSLRFKADTEDLDCDGLTDDIVVFNKGGLTSTCPHDGLFPFQGAIFTGLPGDVGYPVVTINAKGYLGTLADNRGYREIEMDVARNKFLAQVEGAFTARAGVTASGSSMTDGRNHDLSGAPVGPGGVGCMADKPGITMDDGLTLPCDANGDNVCNGAECSSNVAGNPCWDVYDPTEHAGEPIKKTPWGVLGLAQADFASMFTPKPTSQIDMTECYPEQQYVWFKGTGGARFNSASPCSNYGGILVVHNEGFDPDWWEANCTSTPLTGACADPTNQPAVFDMNGNVQWTGIVIADQVVRVNGTPTILGGIISLASGGIIDSDITGNIDIKYSCEAVQGAVNQGYKTRLGWHRLR